ncbi:hypothetical protein N7452_006277 [Penicillium brevicompactum]|uniref:Uncharacterized protein n=1 Tax=Penicillium brevicompactum TaxID=5074 RepID=A0A9W9QML2_PENBR|nr:hypothetical protein N7452_006277 [Penicillium brevicompactum]
MPRPKKLSLPKQKTTLLSFWQPSSVPEVISVPAENSIEISDLAKKVTCLMPQGLHSGLDALNWTGEVLVANAILYASGIRCLCRKSKTRSYMGGFSTIPRDISEAQANNYMRKLSTRQLYSR